MNNKYVVYIAGIIIILGGGDTILNPEPGTVELFGIESGPKGALMLHL